MYWGAGVYLEKQYARSSWLPQRYCEAARFQSNLGDDSCVKIAEHAAKLDAERRMLQSVMVGVAQLWRNRDEMQCNAADRYA